MTFSSSTAKVIEYCAGRASLHRAGRLRYLYRYMAGLDPDHEESKEDLISQPIFFYMDWTDWTTDMDKESQYEMFVNNIVRKGRLDDKP